MSEKRFVAEQVDVVNEDETEVWDVVFDTESTYAFMVRDTGTASDLCDLLNEQQATIEHLKKRLYEFEKRKIIEESEIDEDVIPKVKLLRTEFFGEKYE